MINLARHFDRDSPKADPEVQEQVIKELTEAGMDRLKIMKIAFTIF